MEVPEIELLAPGHRGCAGCGASIGVRLALKVLGKNTVAISATGCLEVMTTPFPESAWQDYHSQSATYPYLICGKLH